MTLTQNMVLATIVGMVGMVVFELRGGSPSVGFFVGYCSSLAGYVIYLLMEKLQ